MTFVPINIIYFTKISEVSKIIIVAREQKKGMEKENEMKENEWVNKRTNTKPHTHSYTGHLHEPVRLVCYGMRINTTGVTEQNKIKPNLI